MGSIIRFGMAGLGALVLTALPASGFRVVQAADAPPAIQIPGAEPFQPPALADVDAKAAWVDMPVMDSLKLLHEKLAKEQPQATIAEASRLVNDSAEANAKILSAYGRPPASDAEVNYDATITRHIMGDVKSMNPILISSVEENDVQSLTGVGLFSFDWDLKPFANSETVVSWQSSADHLIDKVVMRDDLTWSDGKPITAYDVQFSFVTIMNPQIKVPAVRSGTDKLRAVVAYDSKTLLFFHKDPLATNVWNLNFPIMPKHVFESTVGEDPTLISSPAHIRQEEQPVVGGSYVLKSRAPKQELVLERRESFYMHGGKQVRDKPYFKTVRFSVIQEPATALLAIQKGDLDEMQIMPEQWTSQTTSPDFYANCTKVRQPEWLYFYFGWNLKAPWFSDVRVRRAMAYTMDYQEMLNTLCYGLYEPSSGIFHPSAWMYPKNAAGPYQQDLDKAEDLLDEAGWVDSDGDGIRDKEIDGKLVKFEFTMLCSPIPLRVNLCTLMKENLEKIGIICNVQRMERTALQQKMLDKEYEAAFAGWGTGADPSTIDNIWKTGEQRNFGSYSNAEVDRLLKEAEREFDRNKQAELYGRIHSIIYEEQPYTFLYFQSAFYAFNKQLRGYYFSPRGPYHYGPGFGSLWRATAQ
jgi:peptide/nickel transport system substrate-binding protein